MEADPGLRRDFCEGLGGYHQMDVTGEALHINRKHLLALAVEEADLLGSQRLYNQC